MMSRLILSLALLLFLPSCSALSLNQSSRSDLRPLKLATWNLEFLAEREGAGCEPRSAKNYAAMRKIVNDLDADVVAFQEAESVAAAERIFDLSRYIIVMEAREGSSTGTCSGHPEQPFIRQAVGFAIRIGISFERHADVTSLMLGDPQLRPGVAVTVRAKGHAPIRLLSVHLKSGCFSGHQAKACPILLQQIPALESWIDSAAVGRHRFAVMGDWNRRLGNANDSVWTEIDDGEPRNADLRLADEGVKPGCDPRYDSFIDHIVLNRQAGAQMQAFSEVRYAPGEKHFSDHCPVTVTLRR